MARAISAMVNDCDDRGVLAGNWSGKYEVRTSSAGNATLGDTSSASTPGLLGHRLC